MKKTEVHTRGNGENVWRWRRDSESTAAVHTRNGRHIAEARGGNNPRWVTLKGHAQENEGLYKWAACQCLGEPLDA